MWLKTKIDNVRSSKCHRRRDFEVSRGFKSQIARTKKATFSLFTSVAMSNYLYAISELCSVKIALLRYEVHQKKSQREESIV